MHLFTLVLLPPYAEDIEAAVANLLAPYDAQQPPQLQKHFWDITTLRRMRLAPESPLLRKITQALSPPLCAWLPQDAGEEAPGLYELIPSPAHPTWDWWRIGGHWDGVVRGAPHIGGATGHDAGTEHDQVHHNCCLVSCLPSHLWAWVLVTPDGHWHEGAWWSEEPHALEEWQHQFAALLRQYATHVAVGVDCHV